VDSFLYGVRAREPFATCLPSRQPHLGLPIDPGCLHGDGADPGVTEKRGQLGEPGTCREERATAIRVANVTAARLGTMLSRVTELSWLSDRSVESVRGALQRTIPELSGGSITVHPGLEQSNPKWSAGSAVIDGLFVVKFAWSRLAAERRWYEAQILRSLGAQCADLRLPEIILLSNDPVLIVTRLVEGDPLTYERVGGADPSQVDRIGAELALFLSSLHRPEILLLVSEAIGTLEAPQPQASTAELRDRIAPWVRADQLGMVFRWCEWVDDVLRNIDEAVFVHGDLHGHNEVWDHDRPALRAVVDFESSGAVEAEYDFRYLPAQGPSVHLLLATARHYQDHTNRTPNIDHVMAWHILTALGDALWRSEAGVALPGGGTPPQWVDELSARLDALKVGPRA